jgi:argininosuccinate synthase
MNERIVLACSGDPDSSLAIPWLAATYRAEIVTMTVDLGRGAELEEVRERALSAGATRAHVLDAREEFARDYLLPALQGSVGQDGVGRDGGDPTAGSLGDPLIAKKLLEIAAMEQADAVACGPELERVVRALNPALRAIVIPHAADPSSRATRGGTAAGPRPVARRPDTPAHVQISFERGVPVAVNGVTMGLVELIDSLSTIAAAHGAAWFTPIRQALDHLQTPARDEVSCTVRVRLFEGACTFDTEPEHSAPLAVTPA